MRKGIGGLAKGLHQERAAAATDQVESIPGPIDSAYPAGMYLYRLETPQGSFVRTMLLAK